MRITQGQATSRAAYYDRNPLKVSQFQDHSSLAPSGMTQRWTYTVPAARKCQVDGLIASMFRQSVGAPVGESEVMINLVGTATGPFVMDIDVQNNVVGGLGYLSNSGGPILLTGDIISCYSRDLSTGGTIAYTTSFHGIEYDQ